MNETLFRTTSLGKVFGRLAALKDVDVTVTQGQIHGLIGPNGSGKSTFVNVVTGMMPPTEGTVFFEGSDITHTKPNVIAAKLGISRTFQLGQVFPKLSCLENVMVGGHRFVEGGLWGPVFGLPRSRARQESDLRRRSLEVLEFVGLRDMAARGANDLGWTDCQLLQIGRALVNEPRLLFLDEPTAGMGLEESEQVGRIIRQVNQQGTTIVLISHDMRFLTGLADYITVLEFGHKICEGPTDDVCKDPRVIEAYLGCE
ncbi:MAG: ABC transporter ATP-binding protein [Armatimonadetes bacterium]|nr:ABC transporter ATP-binding protein [Armatimonadota bacterium]